MMGATTGRREQLIFELGHTPSHDESDFVVGEGNELAHGHVMAFPDWPHGLTLITGPASSGKSHLARIWAVRAGASFAAPGTLEPLSREGGRSPLVIEDVDRVDYEESALFHLVNQAMRDGRPVLMTAREPVANWPFQTDDLKSRARLAAHFAVSTSDDIHLSQMFVKLFGDRQIAVEPKVVAYFVARMERSTEEAVALVSLADTISLERGTAVTRAVAAEALARRQAAHGEGQLALDLEGDDDE